MDSLARWVDGRLVSLLACAALAGGCQTTQPVPSVAAPKELQKITHPPYTIEPPDLLQVDLITAVPKPPYRLKPLDVVGVVVPATPQDAPIAGTFTIEPGGSIYLGVQYGSIGISGLTVEEARAAVEKHLAAILNKPAASVTLVQTRAVQQIRGAHLVRADGTIGLGAYGDVAVVGMSTAQAREAIESHLRKYFQDPEVSLDVVGYNSKVYYVVFDYGGAGQQIQRLPITGNETVLDGISQTAGLPTVADARNIWVSRPAPDNCPPQVLPVDWAAITEQGDTRTNYQILPGDRVFVKANPFVKADVRLARVISPIERVLGVVLLGSSTVNTIRTDPNRNGLGQ